MPVTALIPLSSECPVCGHPIRWSHSGLPAAAAHQDVVPPRLEKAVRPPCPGGCGRTVEDRHHPCDSCWDRLPVHLKRGLLLSLAGVEVSSVRVEVLAYFRKHPPAPASAETKQRCGHLHAGSPRRNG